MTAKTDVTLTVETAVIVLTVETTLTIETAVAVETTVTAKKIRTIEVLVTVVTIESGCDSCDSDTASRLILNI